MVFYPPKVATSTTIFSTYSTDKCTFQSYFSGSVRFFLTSTNSGYTEVTNYLSGEKRQITLASAGSDWRWRAILGSGDVVYNVDVTPGSFSRIYEYYIHEDYYDTGVAGSYNGIGSYISPVISSDIQLANLNRARLEIIGSNLSTIQGSLSNNGSWFGVDVAYVEKATGSFAIIPVPEYTFAGSGRKIQYRLYDPSNNAYVEQVHVEYKGDDY